MRRVFAGNSLTLGFDPPRLAGYPLIICGVGNGERILPRTFPFFFPSSSNFKSHGLVVVYGEN